MLLVVWFHTGQGPTAGFLGVDIFFVISGFVVSRRLKNEAHSNGRVDISDFYRRRIRRLLPAVAVMSVVVTLLSMVLLSPFGPQQRAFRTGGAASAFLANIELYRTTGYFDRSAALNPFLHTWSLSVEEQVFVALPLLFALVLKFGSRRRSSIVNTSVLIAVGSAASLVAALAMTSGTDLGVEAAGRLAFFGMPTRFWEFGAGILIGLCLSNVEGSRWTDLLGAVGLAAIVVLTVVLSAGVRHPGPWTVLLVVATAAVLVAGGSGGPAAAALSWRPITAIGDVSYGWYLWHWPALVFCSVLWPGRPELLLVVAVASLLPAWISYRFLEQPVRSSQWWTPRRTWSLGVACIAVPIGVLVGAWHLASSGLGLEEPSGWYDYPPSELTRCHIINRDAPNPDQGDDCTIYADWDRRPGGVGGVVPPDGTVMVIGDELANGLVPGVLEVARGRGLAVVQRTRAGCPFVVGVVPDVYGRCEQWQKQVMSEVERLRPDLLVIAAQAPRYLSDDDGGGVADVGGGAESSTISTDEWASGLSVTLDEIERLGVPVLLVGPVPDFGAVFPRERLSYLRPDPDEPVLSRASVDGVNRRSRELLNTAAAGRLSVGTIDPTYRLCDQHHCPAVVDGHWNYLGPLDLTATGSRKLAVDLEPAMERLLSGSR